MNSKDFQQRTKALALRVIKLVEALPRTRAADVLGRQILRSATSVAANYRAACHAQSRNDMIKKLKIVEEEVDETMLWLELIGEAGIVKVPKLAALIKEAGEIKAMTVASIKTLRKSAANRQSAIVNRQ